MRLWNDIEGFVRAFRSPRGDDGELGSPPSLARTLDGSTHVRGARDGIARASTEPQHEIVIEGHEEYLRSFEDHLDG